jgi:hypothetical protein
MNLNAEQNAFLGDVAKLIEFIDNKDDGVLITGGELYRTADQQRIYYNAGLTNTMHNSKHLKRLAIDLNFIVNGKLISEKAILKPYGDYWESLNPKNRWGGNFKNLDDTDHFERNV